MDIQKTPGQIVREAYYKHRVSCQGKWDTESTEEKSWEFAAAAVTSDHEELIIKHQQALAKIQALEATLKLTIEQLAKPNGD